MSRAPIRRSCDKSRFVSSIEEQLRSQEIDLAVHSAKDVPGDDVPGLLIVAVPERVDPPTVLLGAESLDDLPEGATVGTARCGAPPSCCAARPDLEGRTAARQHRHATRASLADGDYDAIVLAAAGLQRLGVGGDVVPGAARLHARARPGLPGAAGARHRPHHHRRSSVHCPTRTSQRELTAERAAAIGLVASCNTPLGVNATVEPRGRRATART